MLKLSETKLRKLIREFLLKESYFDDKPKKGNKSQPMKINQICQVAVDRNGRNMYVVDENGTEIVNIDVFDEVIKLLMAQGKTLEEAEELMGEDEWVDSETRVINNFFKKHNYITHVYDPEFNGFQTVEDYLAMNNKQAIAPSWFNQF